MKKFFALLIVAVLIVACGDDSRSSAPTSDPSEESSSSVEMSKESSSSVKPTSSEDKRSSSSVKKEDSSSSAVKVSSSSATPKSSSSEEVKQSSSSVVASSSSVKSSSSVTPKSSSSEAYQHWYPLNGDLNDKYAKFTDPRNKREYYYIQIDGKDTAGEAASIKVMAENLNVGEMVRGFKDQKDDSKIERYCYDNDTTNCDRYGGLYQWAEMMQLPFECNSKSCADSIKPNHQGICPNGWRLLTYNDFYIIVNSNGNTHGVEGVRSSFGFGGYNTTGYSLVGAGARVLVNEVGGFDSLNELTAWYYPTEITVKNIVYPNAGHTNSSDTHMYSRDIYNYTKLEGFSVRCVMVE